MAGTEKRRSTEPRNPVTMGVTATQDSTSDWRRGGAQVKKGCQAYTGKVTGYGESVMARSPSSIAQAWRFETEDHDVIEFLPSDHWKICELD
jgi:hypothetical protein